MIPVTRKTLEKMNEYYADIVSGLIMSEQQHCQMESALMNKLNEKNKPKTDKKSQSTKNPLVGYE